MFQNTLTNFVEVTATQFAIPGVAVGVWMDGQAIYACYGVTSIDNPLPVTPDTLFTVGSVTKTFTATTVMCLVADGRIELNAPVRRYVPELKLADEKAADRLTVLHLLNHTAGLAWGVLLDTGEGDDALAKYVANMTALELIAAPGTRCSYSQAGYNLVGRIVEKVTGLTFEKAVASLVLEPLGLTHSFFARDDIMTRRFSVGHERSADGTLSVARLWKGWRGDGPGGGLASSAADLLRWARFHLDDGRMESGERILSVDLLQRMQEPTAQLRASNLGDTIGIGWFLRNVDGVRTSGHGGSASGQFADLLIVPERAFAVVALSNAHPDGIPANKAVVRWALQTYLGLTDRDPEPRPFSEAQASEFVGLYENDVMTLTIDTTAVGLRLEVLVKPEIRAALSRTKEIPKDHEPFDFGLLPGAGDEYIITSGAFKGQRGFFTRNEYSAIVGIDLAGRLFNRVPPVAP